MTVNGVTYPPAICPAGACDPRGIGLNPIVSQIWSKEMPLPNSPSAPATSTTRRDSWRASARLRLPTTTWGASITISATSGTGMLTYRDYKLVNLTDNQVDIGGVLPGDTFGTPAATAPRPQQPSVWTTGMTTTINPSTTNTFVFSYLRNFWQWSDASGQPQLPGLGGALNLAARAPPPYPD